MKFGYCYICNSIVIPNPFDECKCGNIYGSYVNDTDCVFFVSDIKNAKVIGIHTILLDIILEREPTRAIQWIEYYVSKLNLEGDIYNGDFKVIWNKPWTQSEYLGIPSSEGSYEFGTHAGYHYD